MRVKKHDDGYTMWLSVNDTYNWAHRANNSWPCSQLSGKRVRAVVDNNGVFDLYINGIYPLYDIDGNELTAIIGDHLPKDLRQFWPCWERSK